MELFRNKIHIRVSSGAFILGMAGNSGDSEWG